ncbi:hypothetical protein YASMINEVIRUS_40 [Yasminevirus sp. GU-2018]|uniref:Uncharacterized protein n=1 Tax=Yasminevirus sp. GU-2018 TaxID=2420051 RepID=A0A5K0U776_9VIRU|nr:hypothetical protein YASMINEVIRUS_40 [Yasminevirus sp. GU-2018]
MSTKTGEKRKLIDTAPLLCPYSQKSLRVEGLDSSAGNLSVVEKHARFFSTLDKEGTLTPKSIIEGHSEQQITSGVDIKQRAILNMLYDKGLDSTAHNIACMYNPASTGLWDTEGNFNRKRYEELCKFAITTDEKAGSKRVITEKIMNKFREVVHGDKNFGIATNVFYVVPVPWKKVTDGSISELFKYYNDCWVMEDGELVPAHSVESIERFYTDPCTVMQMRMKGELPAKKP